ncbi:MAG TPA: hypothetical protein VGX48_15335 [Pyrinomonadaceae bacterium]|jgi:hypothetical protein|nr:hypothetical protein [Pyrinomonadaceae bacterium]
MRRTTPTKLFGSLALLVVALPCLVSAQAVVDARSALTSFPESQAVLFINARRIIHEALPRTMPPAEYDKLLAEPQKAGFDVRSLDYAVAGIRFADPAKPAGLPEVIVVIKGSFNADALLALGRVALGTQKEIKSRRETYGSKTIEIIDTSFINDPPKPTADGSAAPPPKPSPYPEVAVMALDANTLVAGVPAYVRSFVDSAGGQGRLKATTVELASKDPNSLWSLTADIPASLPEYVKGLGMPSNSEAEQMLTWLRQISVSQGMDAVNFSLQAALMLDSPEHASALSGIVRMGVTAAQAALNAEVAKKTGKDGDEARTALGVVKTLVNRTEGSTLILSASVPQATIAAMVKKEMEEKAAKQSPATKPTPRPRARRRARRR